MGKVPRWFDLLEGKFEQDVRICSDQDEKTPKDAEVGPIWPKDSFLLTQKDVRVPTLLLVQAKAEDEEEE